MSSLTHTNNNFPSRLENFFGRDVNNFFNASSSGVSTMPAVNIAEYAEAFRIEVAAPGLQKENFKLTLNHTNLTISAQQEIQEEAGEESQSSKKYTRREFSYSSFQRTFTLPTSVDAGNIQASYTNGVLTIELPKREEAKTKPSRQIEIGG